MEARCEGRWAPHLSEWIGVLCQTLSPNPGRVGQGHEDSSGGHDVEVSHAAVAWLWVKSRFGLVR